MKRAFGPSKFGGKHDQAQNDDGNSRPWGDEHDAPGNEKAAAHESDAEPPKWVGKPPPGLLSLLPIHSRRHIETLRRLRECRKLEIDEMCRPMADKAWVLGG